MKLLSFALLGLSLANDESEENNPDYSDDLRYTRCQAVHLQALSGITVPESHITEDEPAFVCPDPEADSGDADAWQNGVRKWDQNFNEVSDRWEVGYFYESESDSAKVSTIDKKLQEFKSMTCVDFKKVSKNDSKYAKKIKIVFSGGCASYVGSHYAEQTLWLGPRCENSYIPLHEAMHAVGFWHEHQRGDRNNHVQINKNACSMTGSSFDVNFENTHFNWGNTGHAYDFGSIMHYDPFACAKSRNNPVITYPGTNDPVKLTKTSTFSDLDIAQINKMYPCAEKPVSTTKATTTTVDPNAPKVWHGEKDIATWELIGGYRQYHGEADGSLFDDKYGNRNMWHSLVCDTSDRGVKITFKKTVTLDNFRIFTRSHCCRDRYFDVCVLVDGVKAACTPREFPESQVGKTIDFKDHWLDGMENSAGKEFYIKWPNWAENCGQIEELFIYYYEGGDPVTTKPPTTVAPTTTTEGRVRKCDQERVTPPKSKDTCVDLNSISYLNMKVEKDGYSDGQNAGSFASVRCQKGYQLNLKDKLKTKATCMCSGGTCHWKFSKGDIMCVQCRPPILQGKDGRAITVINRWDTGVTILWRIKAYEASTNGWSSALDLKTPMLSKSHWVESFALDTVGKSNDWQYFTFTPKDTSNIWDATQSKARTVMMMVTFNFIDEDEGNIKKDIDAVIKASNYYYKTPAGDQSCAVDRFDCYPT